MLRAVSAKGCQTTGDGRAPSCPSAALLAIFVSACLSTATPIEDAVLLSEKGRPRDAIAVLETHLAKHPGDIAERRLLVRLDAVVGDLGKARAEAGELVARLGPASPVPWIELGHALEFAHEYDDALALYDRASDVAPRNPAGPREGG